MVLEGGSSFLPEKHHKSQRSEVREGHREVMEASEDEGRKTGKVRGKLGEHQESSPEGRGGRSWGKQKEVRGEMGGAMARWEQWEGKP